MAAYSHSGLTSGVALLRLLLRRTNSVTTQEALRSGDDHTSQFPSTRNADLSLNLCVGQLVSAYFASYHTSYPFVHEATFRAQYHHLIPRPDSSSWDLLLQAVIALGAWACAEEQQTGVDEALFRRTKALAHHSSVVECASMTLVTALTLMSNLAQKSNRPNTGWNFLGLAVRMALSLGLHRELADWKISLFEREMRRRVWWGLFIHDSGASTTFGRAILLPPRDLIDVKQVLNIHDEVGI